MNLKNRHCELLDGYCSGALTEAEFAELEEALRGDVKLRQLLIEYRTLDSDLRGFASVPTTDQPASQVRTMRRLRIEVWSMAAAIVILLGGVAFLGVRESHSQVEPSLDHGVAVLTQAIDAQWKDRDVRQGDSMAPGSWQLTAGTAELEFYSGASVILEAPAELEIVSENGGVLHVGKLRAQVPLHAHGFTITSKEVELVDLGTSFGMEVGAESGTAVHVFEGKVELFKPGSDRRQGAGVELLAGEGRRINVGGAQSVIRASDIGFVSPLELDRQSQTRQQLGFEHWKQSAAVVAHDARLLGHYDFETPSGASRELINRSSREYDGLTGAIIGARWGVGRWPAKGALDYKRPGDRVRIEVPGQSKSVTLVAWLRIDGFDHPFASLLLSDGWDRPGAVHWQIHKDGFVELAVWHGESRATNNSRAPFVMRSSDFGRWIQLAVVYDGDAKIVSHYRDGEPLGVIPLPEVVPLAIGKAEIGNWTPPPHDSRQIRNFNGRMDELILFDQALTATELARLYEDGKP